MHWWQQWWQRLRQERGSNVAQAAAVALMAAALVGALFSVAPRLGGAVERSYGCLAGALGGGGAGCGGAATQTGGQPGNTAQTPGGATNVAYTPAAPAAPSFQDELAREFQKFVDAIRNGNAQEFLKQLGGFFKGFGQGAWDFLKGFWDLGKDIYGLISGNPEVRAKYAALLEAFARDPVGMLKAMGTAILEPVMEDWRAGRYGEAIGRLTFEIVSSVVGDKGVGKLAKLGKADDILRAIGSKGDDVTDIAKHADDVPCLIHSTPGRNGPGLARPLGKCKTTRRTNIETEHLNEVRRRGGDINYGDFDALGRPTGIQARITKDMIGPSGTGSEPLSSIKPPGFDSSKGHARGHLLGDQLGGSGKVDSNLVTLFQDGPNSPVMRDFETQVRRSIENGPDGYYVDYTATPIYQGDNPIPVAITITAKGQNGGAHNIDLAVTIINKQFP